MRIPRPFTQFLLVALVATGLAAVPLKSPPARAADPAVKPQGSMPSAAEQKRIREFWTPERMAEAARNPIKPKKLDLDERQLPAAKSAPAAEPAQEGPEVVDPQRQFANPPTEAQLRSTVAAQSGKLKVRFKVDGRSLVWTAAHCLQEFGGDLFFDVMFVPAHDNRYPGPPVFGTFVGGPIYTTLGWQLGAQIQALRGEDYGGLIVSRNESGQTLSEAIGVQNAATLMGPDPAKGIAPVNEDARAYIYGYPGTDPNALNYCASRPIVSGDQIVPVNYARCRMREGASGGGWFQYEFDEDTCLVWGRLVGVTSYDVNATLMGSSWITPVAVALYLIAETYLPDEDDFPDPPQDPVSAPSSSPEQPAVEPSQVCPVPAPSEVYVPSVRTGSNPFGSSMDTGLQIFNSSGSATSAELRYVREDGSTLPTENITVPANGSITITKYRDQATGLRLPENFTGSAYIASTGAGKGLSAAVNHIVNNRALASSSAATLENGRSRPATEPSKEVRLPLLMNDNYGTSTWYTVQNTTASEITVTALYSYTKSDGTPGFETAVLEPYASVTFDQRTLAGAPKVLSGVIQASGPVAAVVFQQTGGRTDHLLQRVRRGRCGPRALSPADHGEQLGKLHRGPSAERRLRAHPDHAHLRPRHLRRQDRRRQGSGLRTTGTEEVVRHTRPHIDRSGPGEVHQAGGVGDVPSAGSYPRPRRQSSHPRQSVLRRLCLHRVGRRVQQQRSAAGPGREPGVARLVRVHLRGARPPRPGRGAAAGPVGELRDQRRGADPERGQRHEGPDHL
jgi:hypothetical protein